MGSICLTRRRSPFFPRRTVAELPDTHEDDDDDEYPPLDPAYDSEDGDEEDEVIVLSPTNYPSYSRPANYPNYCHFGFGSRRLGDIGGSGKSHVVAAATEVCSRGALHVHCHILDAYIFTPLSRCHTRSFSTKHLTCKL